MKQGHTLQPQLNPTYPLTGAKQGLVFVLEHQISLDEGKLPFLEDYSRGNQVEHCAVETIALSFNTVVI